MTTRCILACDNWLGETILSQPNQSLLSCSYWAVSYRLVRHMALRMKKNLYIQERWKQHKQAKKDTAVTSSETDIEEKLTIDVPDGF